MKQIILILVLLLLCSCKKDKEAIAPASATDEAAVPKVSYEIYEIKAGSLGPISVGMHMADTERFTQGLIREEPDSYNFGYDGGGTCYLYKDDEKPVFAIIPARDSDSVIALIAIDKSLRTTGGLRPGMSADELKDFYPKGQQYNEMMGWAQVSDRHNGWEFILDEKGKTVDRIAINPVNTCAILHDGRFTFKDNNGEVVVAKFEGDAYTEEYEGGKYFTISKITWLNDCEYESMFAMTTLPGVNIRPGTVMRVKIDKVSGSDIYFTSTMGGQSTNGKFIRMP